MSKIEKQEWWISGWDRKGYKLRDGAVLTAFVTNQNPGKAEAFKFIPADYHEQELAARDAEIERLVDITEKCWRNAIKTNAQYVNLTSDFHTLREEFSDRNAEIVKLSQTVLQARETIAKLEADRDKWKAMAEELGNVLGQNISGLSSFDFEDRARHWASLAPDRQAQHFYEGAFMTRTIIRDAHTKALAKLEEMKK